MKLGITVKDKITGFEGVVTGECVYITGCDQALVQPKIDKDGKHVDGRWYDIDRLEIIDPKPMFDPKSVQHEDRPGPDMPAPIK